MYVESGNRINRHIVIFVANRRVLARQGQQVKDLQVHPEGIIGLASIDLHPSGQAIAAIVDCGIHQADIVGGRFFANIDRRGGLIANQDDGTVGSGFGDGDELFAIPIRIGQVVDRAGVVEEGQPRGLFNPAGKGVGDIRLGITVVVDKERIVNVAIPLKIIGAALWRFKGNPVADQDDIVLIFRGDKNIGIGIIGESILGDQRGFAMAGGTGLRAIGNQDRPN